MTLFSALRALPDMEVVGLNFSSATTPELLLKTFDHYCEYRKTPNGVILSPVQVIIFLYLIFIRRLKFVRKNSSFDRPLSVIRTLKIAELVTVFMLLFLIISKTLQFSLRRLVVDPNLIIGDKTTLNCIIIALRNVEHPELFITTNHICTVSNDCYISVLMSVHDIPFKRRHLAAARCSIIFIINKRSSWQLRKTVTKQPWGRQ